MVKKRCVRTPNKVKNEDKESSPAEEDVEMQESSMRDVARDYFKGVLDSVLLDHSSSSSGSSEDEASPPPVRTPKKRETPTRRKKKKTDVEQQFHHTFVMKLFDRSVDLAQFNEDTPLYPICRGWMANQPRSSYDVTASIKREVKEDEEDESKGKFVHSLPKPDGPIRTRIPSPERAPLVGINEETFNMNVNKATLLAEHMERWTKVRSKWMAASQACEERYGESAKILSEIFHH